jgi:hypothetical protein
MTFDADILEHPAPKAPCAADPRIARAEMWLCMLGGLMDMGIWLVRALTRQVAPGLNDPTWTGPRITFPDRCNPITIYGRIARAVRLAVALRMKIMREIADLRAGKPLSPAPPAPQAMPQQAAPTLAGEEDVEEVESLEERPELERPEVPLREAPELVGESARFYRLLNGPLKDAVAAICADFGLKPDWSQWTEDGFPPPAGEVTDWAIFRTSEGDTTPPPERDDGDPIVWRPIWRQPRRPRSKAPLDPRYDRGPAVWPDFNDYYFNDVLRNGDIDGL